MIFDAAAFWKVLAVFIFVVLALIAVSLLVDSYVRYMEWKIDRNERFKADVAKLIVDSVNNNAYTGSCREMYEPEGAGNEEQHQADRSAECDL